MNMKNMLVTTGIALILVSTLTIGSIAFGKGNPWDQVWAAIHNIKTRLTALEQEEAYVHTVRFVDWSLHTISKEEKTKTATFTLTPDDSEYNAILDYWFYFELSTWGPTTIQCEIQIHGEAGPGEGSSKYVQQIEIEEPDPSFKFTHVQKVGPGPTQRPVPNQSQYTIEVYFAQSSEYPTSIWTFILIMTYAEGLT